MAISEHAPTVLITGCSDGGLGAGLAKSFHRKGYRVFATARKVEKMQDLRAIGIVDLLVLDVDDRASLEAARQKVEEATGGSLDLLINNAGGGYSMPVLDCEPAEIDRILHLNITTIVQVTQVFFPLLRKSTRGGIVANNTSSASVCPVPFQASYNAAKAGAGMLTEILRMELEPFQVRVVELKTAAVKSNFFENNGAGQGKRNADIGTDNLVLPPDSYYAKHADMIKKFRSGQFITNMQDTDVWSERVAGDLDGMVHHRSRKLNTIWRGADASKVWFLSAYFPRSLMVTLMSRIGGLDQFKPDL